MVKLYIFFGRGRSWGLLRSPAKLLTNIQVFLKVCKCVTTRTGIHARSSGLPRFPADLATTLTSPFHSISQTHHFLYKYAISSAPVCFYFPQRQFPLLLRRLTDSCVCACIIISFTEPVCCRSLWQTSITQH